MMCESIESHRGVKDLEAAVSLAFILESWEADREEGDPSIQHRLESLTPARGKQKMQWLGGLSSCQEQWNQCRGFLESPPCLSFPRVGQGEPTSPRSCSPAVRWRMGVGWTHCTCSSPPCHQGLLHLAKVTSQVLGRQFTEGQIQGANEVTVQCELVIREMQNEATLDFFFFFNCLPGWQR
jgi:hypothetical protein